MPLASIQPVQTRRGLLETVFARETITGAACSTLALQACGRPTEYYGRAGATSIGFTVSPPGSGNSQPQTRVAASRAALFGGLLDRNGAAHFPASLGKIMQSFGGPIEFLWIGEHLRRKPASESVSVPG